jgi:hypothetical protein
LPTHVDFLASLFVLWGVLTMLVGLATMALAVGASALIEADHDGAQGGQLAAGLVATAFLALAVIALVWGLAHVAVGVPLRRRRHWSRLAALMLGSIDLALLPYGTALGCYTLWTLLRPPAKALFEKADPSPDPG